jgi:hypothetical protein
MNPMGMGMNNPNARPALVSQGSGGDMGMNKMMNQ